MPQDYTFEDWLEHPEILDCYIEIDRWRLNKLKVQREADARDQREAAMRLQEEYTEWNWNNKRY